MNVKKLKKIQDGTIKKRYIKKGKVERLQALKTNRLKGLKFSDARKLETEKGTTQSSLWTNKTVLTEEQQKENERKLAESKAKLEKSRENTLALLGIISSI